MPAENSMPLNLEELAERVRPGLSLPEAPRLINERSQSFVSYKGWEREGT
jgi:hypothetical protein